jgi:hypothetical protein
VLARARLRPGSRKPERRRAIVQASRDGAGTTVTERVNLGATAEDLVAYRDELPGLASVVAIRGGGH